MSLKKGSREYGESEENNVRNASSTGSEDNSRNKDDSKSEEHMRGSGSEKNVRDVRNVKGPREAESADHASHAYKSAPGAEARGVNSLFVAANAEGVLSPSSLQVLTGVDLGAQIQAGLGISADDVEASEVVLLTIMPDDSGSIRAAGHEQAVRDGHNLVLDALKACKQKDGILAHTRYLNGSVLFPYRPIDQAVRMTAKNYDPVNGTPLYDQAVVLLGSVLAKTREFEDNGVAARSVTLIITDGADQHSSRARAKDVAALVRDLARAESHIIAAMGISDGMTDFKAVFREMGIADRWILTPGSNPSEIRKAFQVFSQSAVRASQAATFSRASLGGFVN